MTARRRGAADAVSVLVPRPLAEPLDYLPPPGLPAPLAVGDYVQIPLRGGETAGLVWGPSSGDLPVSRLREISRRHDSVPAMGKEMRAFLARSAAYTMTPLGSMLALGLKGGWLKEPMRRVRGVRRAGPAPERMTPAREAVLRALDSGAAREVSITELAAQAGVSTSVVDGLVRCGTLEITEILRSDPAARESPTLPVATELSDDQQRVAGEVIAAVGARCYRPFLLQGVTGSGKTEVYLEAVAANLSAGRQTLVLLPEIALTDAFLRRLSARLGSRASVWHSRLGNSARGRIWRGVARGEVSIVAGARSALFLPFRKLGLIVVDEEHDGSYKQEDGAVYNARDLAVLRASIADVPVVLTSATASLESYVNVQRGRYERLHLPERFGSARLPRIEAVNLRRDRPEPARWLAPPTVDAVAETLSAGKQALLFLNRRGYAPLTLCRNCGHRLECPDCDTCLVAHGVSRRLMCHQCGFSTAPPPDCPECSESGTFAACGPGVERIAEEVAERFPEARRSVLSSDTVRGGKVLERELEAVANGDVDIVIGTQIVAKGHHFPEIAMVGVVDADLCLRGGDLRAGERTFQIVRQVTGRAGRVSGDSRALLQTLDPDNPVMQAILHGDEEAFLHELAEERRQTGAPPFTRYVAVIVSGPDAGEARAAAMALARKSGILERAGIRLYGPAAPPFTRLRNRFRWRLLAIAPRHVTVQRAMTAWRDAVRLPRRVRVVLDVDPQSFL